MKITFFSNFLNHHQLPFCLELKKKLGDNFKFVATEQIPEERLLLGYDDMNSMYDFVVRAYEDETLATKLGNESDVVIIGSASTKYIKERLNKNRLTLRYSERIFKDGFNLKKWLSLIKHFTILERKNVYLLCSSAYSANDFNRAGAYVNKCFKWGYFPQTYEYDIDKLLAKKDKNKNIEILWCGRLINWKHPEYVIEIAKKLKEDNIKFNIKIVGNGELMDHLNETIKVNNLEKEVKMLGAVNNKDVRNYMEKADIYLFTSDYGEGWGAVLNEAMNSACAVVASHAIGAVPFLIKNNENGLVYNNDSIEDLYIKTKELILNNKKRKKIAKQAYLTINNKWNASIAAERLLKLIEQIQLNKNTNIFKDGPCSIARNISQNKMYNFVVGNKNDKKNNK